MREKFSSLHQPDYGTWSSLPGKTELGPRQKWMAGMSTLAAVSTTANRAPSKVQLWGNQEATGKQRKPVCRRRQMDRRSLQEKGEARGHQVRETLSQSPQPLTVEAGSGLWNHTARGQTPPLTLNRVTLDELLLNYSVPQFPHRKHRNHSRAYFTRLWKSSELTRLVNAQKC